MNIYEEKARKYFRSGYNCAQAVFAAFADKLEMDEAAALRLSSSFGGGVGRLRSVCGAVSGMVMVIGALYGPDTAGNEEKGAHYARVQQLVKKFEAECGSFICAELLALPENDEHSPVPEARTESYYKKRPCEEYVAAAARIAADYVEKEKI